MKIDNKGWGLNTLLLMICVIIAALLTATFFAIRMNSLLGKENNEDENKLQNVINTTYYINKENSLKSATEKYIKDMEISLTTSPLRFDVNTLISYSYIETIRDNTSNNRCGAYSVAYINSVGNQVINAYIKCDNYTTKGYGE